MVTIWNFLNTDAGVSFAVLFGLACAFLGFVFGEQNQLNKE